MKFSLKQFIVPNFKSKFLFLSASIFFMGFFLSILIEIGFGTDPCSFMNLNVSRIIGLSLGTVQLSLNIFLLVFLFIFNGSEIGFGTILNMTMIGYIADFFCWIWKSSDFTVFLQTNMAAKILLFVAVIFAFILSAAVYMNCQMGVAPYDSIPVIISRALPKVPFFAIRMCYDFASVFIGLTAGLLNPEGIQGSVIGVLIMALTLGPVISAVGKFFRRHIPIFS